ncbi:hypothetical protein AB4M04_05775 [Serratia quinivorans]|uniref:Uncharacterized protein n=2 Tax=Serratia quinivorans TaxID=137545 RepID=A0ABV3UE46_9GAMM
MSGIEEIKVELEKVVKERAAGPLGYIALSFIVYNWSWFYFVIFSSKSAEVKISSVINGFQKLPGLGWPIAAGLLIQVGSPYLKTLITYLTSLAKNMDNKLNHNSENYLSNHIETTNNSLAEKRFLVTATNAKIDNLIAQRDALNREIKSANENVTNLRREEKEIANSINSANKERHTVELFLSANNVTKESFEDLRKILQQKSIELTNIQNSILSVQSCAEELTKTVSKIQDYSDVIDEESNLTIRLILNELNDNSTLIKGFFVTKNGAHFDDANMTMIIPAAVSASLVPGYIQLIESKGFNSSAGETQPDGTTTVQFYKRLTPTDKRTLISYYVGFIGDDIDNSIPE